MPDLMPCDGCGKLATTNRTGKCKDCRKKQCAKLGCKEIFTPIRDTIFCSYHQHQTMNAQANRKRNPLSSGSLH